MAKKKIVSSKEDKKPRKNKVPPTRDIYLSNFHFQEKRNKHVVIIKDVLVTVGSEMTPKQIEEVLLDPYYQIRALRIYCKLEGMGFKGMETLEKYIPLKIDFVQRIGISFAR